MKKNAILIAALAGILLAAQARAQAPGPGVYLGAGAGSVWSNGGSVYSDTVNENTVAGAKIFGGYMQDRFGMEFGFHQLGRFDTELFSGEKVSDMKTRAVSVAGVFSTPIGAGYSFDGRLGLAFTEAKYTCVSLCGNGPPGLTNVDTKKRGTSGMIGIGAGARLARGLSVRIDFDHIGNVHHQVDRTEFTESYDVLSVNFLLQF